MLDERFISLGRFLKNTFGERVHRMNVHIPGMKLVPGENPKGYVLCPGGPLEAPFSNLVTLPVEQQIAKAKGRIRQKYKIGNYIIHFHTTRGDCVDLETIEKTVEKAMQDNEIIGLNITVRMDCLDDKIIRFLSKTAQYIYLWLETGIHSIHDTTLQKLGIQFTRDLITETMGKLMEKNLLVSPHVIFGLPDETSDMMHQTMEEVARMMINGVNINHFFLKNDSPLAEEYRKGEIKLLSREEYVSLVSDFIEILPQNVVLRRIVGEIPPEHLLAPDWTSQKQETLSAISTELENRNSVQGCKNPQFVKTEEEMPKTPDTCSQMDEADTEPLVADSKIEETDTGALKKGSDKRESVSKSPAEGSDE